MKKIEAKTLEEAYAKAAEIFQCSVTDLDYEIVQHPSSGFLGIGAKKAIIVAQCKNREVASEPRQDFSADTTTKAEPNVTEAPVDETAPDEEVLPNTLSTPSLTNDDASEAAILGGFFDEKKDKEAETTTVTASSGDEHTLSQTIEAELKALMDSICFDIDTVEVDVIDGTAYIFIDGEDAALLIGKEGYRYNALSYLLYNWLHNRYGLFIKLEIAQFLASQQEMIRNYIQPVIEHVRQSGWGKTRPLDGILVQIALEQLREEFPDKYVAIKRTREGERYILINEFNKRS